MMKRIKALAAALAVAMLLPIPAAFAAEDKDAASTSGPQISGTEDSIIDSSLLQSKIQALLDEEGVDQENVGIAFYYSGTGDSWYFNGDTWFYPASMYKVPLVMLLAEKVSSGELSQDSEIYDSTLQEVEEHILTYSNNHWAHLMRDYLGGDDVWREEAKKFAQLEDSEYDPDYLDYCYFSPRYMNQVMTTLYLEPERFPYLFQCLDAAVPGEYYEQLLGSQYTIAQKYGSYEDSRGEKYNSCSAIIETPNPIVVTVMTLNVTKYQSLIAQVGQILAEYSLELDGGVDEHLQALAEAQAREEQERIAAEEEAQRQQELQAQQAAQAEQERIEAQEKAEAQAKRKELLSTGLKILAAVAAVGIAVLVAVLAIKLRLSAQRKERERQQRRKQRQRAYRDYDDTGHGEEEDYQPRAARSSRTGSSRSQKRSSSSTRSGSTRRTPVYRTQREPEEDWQGYEAVQQESGYEGYTDSYTQDYGADSHIDSYTQDYGADSYESYDEGYGYQEPYDPGYSRQSRRSRSQGGDGYIPKH